MTAAESYFAAHSRLADRIAFLAERLHDMPAPDDPAVNWGHVGDLKDADSILDLLFDRLGIRESSAKGVGTEIGDPNRGAP